MRSLGFTLESNSWRKRTKAWPEFLLIMKDFNMEWMKERLGLVERPTERSKFILRALARDMTTCSAHYAIRITPESRGCAVHAPGCKLVSFGHLNGVCL